jgi:CRP/FNR family transcriptional regulator, dissimilatory nitrate respiration regulator
MCRDCTENEALALECHQQRSALLRRVYLFEDLSPEHLGQVASSMEERDLPGDQWLCFHEQPADSFFLVLEGEVALLRETVEGEELIVTIVGRGELFGEDLGFLEAPVHPLSARTLGRCRIAEFDCRHFRALLEREPSLLIKLLQTVHRRNVLLINELESATCRSASERLLAFIERQTAGSPNPIPLRIPKHVLASRLSIRPETLSRILGQLKACHRLQEVDGCLLPVTAPGSDEACAECPARFWGCPGPRAPSASAKAIPQSSRTMSGDQPWASFSP